MADLSILTSLYNTGPDSYKNLFLVKIIPQSKSALAEAKIDFSVRCPSFDPPSVEQDSYDVHFMNQKIPKPVAKIKIDRHFELKFRLDSNYELYKYLEAQKKLTFDPENGVTKIDLVKLNSELKLFTVSVDIVKGDMVNSSDELNTETLYIFGKCFVDNVKLSDFSYDSSEPMTVTASIKFVDYWVNI